MTKSSMRKKLSKLEAEKLLAEINVFQWDKPEQYKYVQGLKGDRLRWEFLRRDRGYQDQYKKYYKTRLHPLLGRYISPQKRGDKLPKNFCFVDTLRRGEPLILTPPPIKSLLFTKENPTSGDDNMYRHFGRKLEELYDHNYVVIAFDPMRSPSSQINNARKTLNDLHSQYVKFYPKNTIKGKRNPKDAVKLLRALDAALVGISNQIIGSEIFAKKKSGRQEAAKKDYEHYISVGQERLKAAMDYWRVM